MSEPTANEAVRRRLAIARQIAASFATDPALVATACAGSTARGQADRWSDLELLVVWHEPPTDYQRRRVIKAVSGTASRW